MLRPVHQCLLFRHLRYYQAVRNESAGKFGLESEALLSSADMEMVRYNYEITDGYVVRFFGKFKRFKQIIHPHPRIFLRILQMRRSRYLRELVEFEFGMHIPSKPLSRMQTLPSTHSDPGNDTDDELPHADFELDDNVFPEIGKDLWDLLGDFIKGMYAHAGLVTHSNNCNNKLKIHVCVCTVITLCAAFRMCLLVRDDCRLWVSTETVRRWEGYAEIAFQAQTMSPRQKWIAFTLSACSRQFFTSASA